MENKLRNLYALQQVDTTLDELEELKGDLPVEVRELERRMSELQDQLTKLEKLMMDSFIQRDSTDNEILALKEKLEKYKTQQYQVRSNREYDALTREMDHATDSVAKLEKDMEMLETKGTVAKADIETTKIQVQELGKILEEKRIALAEVSKATEDEERKYHHEREKLVVRINKEDLDTYERIRKARRGSAIVAVKRGACGGCFNKVPPQKLLELRQNSNIYTCEHCGRIIVSDEIAEASSAVA